MKSPQEIRLEYWKRLERVNMAKVHELKIRPEYMHDIWDGTKTFEVRKDDRGFLTGDYLILREYAQQGTFGNYTGREVKVAVTYILRDSCYVRPGYVVMGIRKVGEKS